MFLSEWREFPSPHFLAKKKKLDDSSRLDVVEIAQYLTCFRACFLPARDKDLSAPRSNTDIFSKPLKPLKQILAYSNFYLVYGFNYAANVNLNFCRK